MHKDQKVCFSAVFIDGASRGFQPPAETPGTGILGSRDSEGRKSVLQTVSPFEQSFMVLALDSSCLCLQNARITDLHHHGGPQALILTSSSTSVALY